MTPKYLVIDTTKVDPIQCVVEAGGERVGTCGMLSWEEAQACARWLGLHGGRKLLDAFELALINARVLPLQPHDEHGQQHPCSCEAVEFIYTDTGMRIEWQPQEPCQNCGGEGHHAAPGAEVAEEDLCFWCCGQGWFYGSPILTDMDGNVLPEPAA